jgi:hypothetical protein
MSFELILVAEIQSGCHYRTSRSYKYRPSAEWATWRKYIRSNTSSKTVTSCGITTLKTTQATTKVSITTMQQPQVCTEPQDYTDYYAGRRGNPRLLARSSRAPWKRPTISDGNGTRYLEKSIFTIRRHPLIAKLELGLRDRIRVVTATMTPNVCISIDYVRIGYDEEN